MADYSTLKDKHGEFRLFKRRMMIAIAFMLVLASIILSRYFYLQVIEHKKYITQSDNNRVHVDSIAPKRGLIYDRKGRLLAENQPSFTLMIVKDLVIDLDVTLMTLQSLIDVSDADIERFKKHLIRYRPYEPMPLRFRLTEQERAVLAVNRFRLPGVEVQAQLVRHYPYAELFAHAIGYVGRINDREQLILDPENYSATHHVGKIGIEKYYESELHGIVGYQNVETNARGTVLRVLERHDPVPGKDLHLSIDVDLQQAAFDALAEDRGAVVAIDPNNGQVLSIVSTPSFDSNLFVNGISNKAYSALRENLDLPLFNRSLQGQYPPGSTIKPIVGLAGLVHSVITPASVVADPGWYQLPNDERYYRDWKRSGHAPWVDLHQAIVQSCDVYYYDLAYRLGIDRMSEFNKRFGLGAKLGVDQTSEGSGLIPDREWKRVFKRSHWYPGESLNAGIGQGYVLATPLQLAVATAALASKGKVFKPRLLQNMDGVEPEAELIRQITIKDEHHWEIIHKAMTDVVHGRRGTAKVIKKGLKYKIAGKTGTAQVVGIAQNARYDSEALEQRQRDHALFVGWAPAKNPEIVVAVIVENGEHGSSRAGPVARAVMDAYLLPLLEARAAAKVAQAKASQEAAVANNGIEHE